MGHDAIKREFSGEICPIDQFRHFCKKAKFAGKKKKWWQTQYLFWQGNHFDRHSVEYQNLIDRTFECLSENKDFCKILLQTENFEIIHSARNLILIEQS